MDAPDDQGNIYKTISFLVAMQLYNGKSSLQNLIVTILTIILQW